MEIDQLKLDLRTILREFYGQMLETQKTEQPEFNKGLDTLCNYDEAIEKILKRTSAPDLYEVSKWVNKMASHSSTDSQIILMAAQALAKVEQL